MRWLYLFASCIFCCSAQVATLTLSPAIITNCREPGLGRARLAWTAPAGLTVVVRIGSASGEAMTGEEPSSGTAETGDWVTDGMTFVLTTPAGRELARATARVNCPELPAGAGFFPLRAGNQWVYRRDDRFRTATHETWRVTGVETRGGVQWFIVEGGPAPRMRADSQGRLYLGALLPNGSVTEALWIDPVNNRGQLRLTVSNSGEFADFDAIQGLNRLTGRFQRNVGLVSQTVSLLTGSSGGFVSGIKLQLAKTSDAGEFGTSLGAGIELGLEAGEFDVTGRNTTNCILPCYFVACGLGGGQPDPPGTYKPCFQARLRVSGVRRTPVIWELTDSSGKLLYREQDAAPDNLSEAIVYRQIPLFEAPARALSPGRYRLRVTAADVRSADALIEIK